MMLNRKFLRILFILFDYLAASGAWAAFYIFRKEQIEQDTFIWNNTFILGVILIPIFWMILYLFQGEYHRVRRKYRIKVLSKTLAASIFGVTIIFFVFLLDDNVQFHKQYYISYGTLLLLHFIFTLVPRMLLTSYIVKKVHTKKIGFDTLIVGGSDKAMELYQEIQSLPKSNGNNFIGFVNINGVDKELESVLPRLGHFDDINKILQSHPNIEEVIIALDSTEHEKLRRIISVLQGYPILIKLIPDMYDILSGSVRMTSIFGTPLIEVNSEMMPIWQQILKRMIDLAVSGLAIILLIPVYILLAILVKTSSKGPVFFFQERIGRMGKPFQIIKFRTMYVGSEKDGPQLSSTGDKRITPIGKFLRKTRLDEFPQFYNVLKGDMSLVGPRPERQFFIDKIVIHEPQYRQLNKLRPGITSWGQVKYGYAENVEEMLQRMKFDLLYIKNMTLAMDFKIMFYTIIIMIKGKGK